ncbi:MAG: KH domain-containing protein [Candidatus Nanoarchaeia archaeon]|jgi:ribosomal RNA assembly protein
MYEYRVLIPKERVGVLVGEEGKIKRLIEKKTNTSLVLHEEEVIIMGEDSYTAWLCEQVVKAIGRGFNPRIAINLIKEGYAFEVMNIMDYARNQNDKFRLKSRVIGQGGLVRQRLEQDTNCRIIVFGKTIGVIGPGSEIRTALEAIEMLLKGAQVKTVYKFLEKASKKKLKKELV